MPGKDFTMRLEGQRFFIIGGSSGIVLETAHFVIAQGRLVTIARRSQDRRHRAAASLSGRKKGFAP